MLENNSQHSFQVALTAWYLNDKDKLVLDDSKLIKYALVHDIVVAYSGNYPTYKRVKNVQKEKVEKEAYALSEIKKKDLVSLVS